VRDSGRETGLSEPEVGVVEPQRAESEFRRELRWAMLWPVVTLLVAAGLLVGLVLYVQNANWWVDHTDQVIARATLVERLVADRQSRLRGYLLTDSPSSYTAYVEAESRVLPAIDGLQALVRGDPSQVARLESLRPALSRWAQYAEQQLAKGVGAAAAQNVAFHLIDGEAVQGDIEARLREFVRGEENLRAARVARVHVVTQVAFVLGALFALAAGPALAVTTARRMRRSRRRFREALEAQNRTARSLQKSEEKLLLAEDAANMGSWHWDILGEMVWSDRCKELFGLSPDTAMSYDVFLAAVHPDDRDRVNRAVQEALANRTRYEVEMRVRSPDGSVRWVASKGEAFYDAKGRPERMAGMAMDITERKHAEDSLREADRRKDEFLGMLSHELRNPLAPIRNSVHVLGRADPASAQAARARTIIARQVDHLARLVDDLLDVKRISTGKLRLHTAVMDLTQQVRETIEDLRPLFVKQSLSLELELPTRQVWVNGDRTRLAQVVANLLQNAAKFANAGGHVWVELRAEAGQAHICVRDDGAGIPPELQGTLFEPFVQSDKTLHRTMGGLGLGLSLVRGIAQLHGGGVVAHSEGVGKGAEFVVTLPTTEPAAAAENESTAPHVGAKCRVLIIEDNVDAAESLRDIIQMLGPHEVEVAHDGGAGVEVARKHHPDVVLCDIGLPTMDGYEVARRLRRSGASEARLVALSGYASPEDVGRAIRAGFDYHVPKPPDIEKLLTLVAEAPTCGAHRVIPDDLATGHHEVDAQHASILAAAARLRTASPAASWETLRFLHRRTASHFEYEDALMEDVGYPETAAHKQQHQEFLLQLREFHERLERQGATTESAEMLAAAVETWMTEHILDHDRRAMEYIREQTFSETGGVHLRAVRAPG
jgi:hemerythrin-like metal-binding protein/PAS domain S-box-containing protein